jgi:peptidyl-tRNA hydrolase, PTH1 family
VALRRPRDPASRRGAASDLVILGLGNPGPEFEGSRHNVGAAAVRELAARHNVSLSSERRQRCLSATFVVEDRRVTVAVPTTYMNDAGSCLPGLLKRTSLAAISSLVVAHDELDLPEGRLQFKLGGGLAGHNGLRSLAAVAKTSEFARLRIGIGKPRSKDQGTTWGLKAPTGESRRALEAVVTASADALETLCAVGFDEAQRRVNTTTRE